MGQACLRSELSNKDDMNCATQPFNVYFIPIRGFVSMKQVIRGNTFAITISDSHKSLCAYLTHRTVKYRLIDAS